MAELVAYNCTGVVYQGSHEIFLELKCQVQIRPSLIAVFQSRHSKDEIVDILNVAFSVAFVAQAKDHAWNLDES